jgi:LCP family protein required for cell wall assembly
MTRRARDDDSATQETPRDSDPSSAAQPAPAGKAPRRRRRLLTPWKWLGLALLVVAVLLVAGVTVAYLSFANRSVAARLQVSEYEADQLMETLDPPASATSTEPVYILLIGDDRRSEERARSDALILVRLDPVTQSAVMLSIPRDTRVPIPGHGVSKINHAHSWGGPALAVETVKNFTGLPVHHYISVDFDGLIEMVDVLGGLWIDVDRQTKMNYWRPGDPVIEKGYQQLNGEQCLLYVRSRWFPESDYVRCLHQRTFLIALAKSALEASPTRRVLLIGIAGRSLKSDLTVSQIVDLSRQFKDIKMANIKGRTVPGGGKKIDGVWYDIPDMGKTREILDYMSRGEVPPGSEGWGVQ